MPADASLLVTLFADPEVHRFVDDGQALAPEVAALWIQRSVADLERFGYGTGAVVEPASGALIGWAGFAGRAMARKRWSTVSGMRVGETGLERNCWPGSSPSPRSTAFPLSGRRSTRPIAPRCTSCGELDSRSSSRAIAALPRPISICIAVERHKRLKSKMLPLVGRVTAHSFPWPRSGAHSLRRWPAVGCERRPPCADRGLGRCCAGWALP